MSPWTVLWSTPRRGLWSRQKQRFRAECPLGSPYIEAEVISQHHSSGAEPLLCKYFAYTLRYVLKRTEPNR